MSHSGDHHGEAACWHDLAAHLTAAHGTNPRAIESYAPTLGQLEADHWASHVSASGDGIVFQHCAPAHVHQDPLPEGDRYRAADSYAPFPPAPCWQMADPWPSRDRSIGPDGPEAG